MHQKLLEPLMAFNIFILRSTTVIQQKPERQTTNSEMYSDMLQNQLKPAT